MYTSVTYAATSVCDQRLVGYRNRCPPPEPPHELAAAPLVGDPDVQFVQRHRRRRPGRPGLGQCVRIAHVARGCRARVRAGRPRRTPTTSSAAGRPGGSRLDAPRRSARRTPVSRCTRRDRPPGRRAGTADACWWAAGRTRRFGRRRPGSARRTDRRTSACPPDRWPARSTCRRRHRARHRAACSSRLIERSPLRECVRRRPWSSPNHSASTAAVSSPSAGAATACGVVAVDREGQARRQVLADTGLVQPCEHRIGRHPFVADNLGEGAVALPQHRRRRQRIGDLRGRCARRTTRRTVRSARRGADIAHPRR